MTDAVFLSNARASGAGAARALAERLRGTGVGAFFDEADLDAGESIPARLVAELLAAKALVVFADATYFTRWYCLRDFYVVLGAFNALVRRGPDS